MEEMVLAMESLAVVIHKQIKELDRTKELEKRKMLAEIIKMLCESMGVFAEGPPYEMDADEEEELPF